MLTGGSADPRVRPAPLWGPWLTSCAQVPSNGSMFWKFECPAKLYLERCSKLFFQGIFMLGNIFIFLWKKEKVLEKFLAWNDVLKIQICSGKNRKSQEKQNDGGWIWDTYRFTFGKGSSFWVWRAGPFSFFGYHCYVRPGELDEDSRPYATSSLHVFSWIVWS